MEKASLLDQAASALALQKEAMELSQKLGEENARELENALEKVCDTIWVDGFLWIVRGTQTMLTSV